MKKATLKNVQARLSDYVAASAKEPVLIVHNGEPVAMLMGLDRKQRRNPVKLRTVLKGAWKDYEQHGGVAHEEFWADMAKEMSRPSVRGPRASRNARKR